MLEAVYTSLGALVLSVIFWKAFTWRRNHTLAQAAGFPVFYSPVHITDMWWLLLYPLLVPLLNRLPKDWTNPWLPMAQIWRIWKTKHQPFEETNSDTFILATPNGNMLWTCDPEVVHQLFTQHSKSQVPVDIVKFYDTWGPTVGSVEGEEWKIHRKVITSGFNWDTNTKVWKEAISQASALATRWIEEGAEVPVVKKWTSRLSLHVISAVFFDKKLGWEEHTNDKSPVPKGHKISYEEALFTILARLGTIFMTPRVLLRNIPLPSFSEANTAFNEWTKYMLELRDQTVARMDQIASKKNRTILESIVVAATPGVPKPDSRQLPEESLLGNIFFTLLAGHETTGNTMAFVLLLLTIHPDHQKRVQDELDHQLGERPKEEWLVERDFQTLQNGFVGAVLKEVLRLYCVVQFVLRRTVTTLSVTDSKGEQHTIPDNTFCLLNFSAAFMNSTTWPETDISSERRNIVHNSPAVHFDPSRFVEDSNSGDVESSSPRLWPFGQGPRSCPGRAFAQIESIAVIATIFKYYSLELVVEKATVEAANGDPVQAYNMTRDNALRRLVDDIESNVNIYLLKEVPIRIMRRGEQASCR